MPITSTSVFKDAKNYPVFFQLKNMLNILLQYILGDQMKTFDKSEVLSL